MRLVPSLRQAAASGLALTALILLAACKGSSGGSSAAADTITVSGNITYTRIPLVKDANGVPTGLETDPSKFESKPARGIQVRFYNSVQETAPDGTKVTVWKFATTDSFTDILGNYSATVKKDTPVFVEVVSRVGTAVRLVADPAGMTSTVSQADRPVYLMRKGLDGSSPDNNPTPGTAAAANATVNFTIGLQDKWWLGVTSASLATSAVRETQGTGSRVLAILDSVFSFQSLYGRVLPSSNPGDILDLHYRPGLSEPRGSYVEFDRNLFPQSYDSFTGSRHFFGTLRGASANDDAWDEAVIFTLLGRNNQGFTWVNSLQPVGQNLTHLAPDLALAEGFAHGMAANLLKSPYLADTHGATATVQDIRDRSGLSADQISAFSGPNLAALCWDLILTGNSIALPGTSSTWSNINTSALVRFFALVMPRNTDATKYVDVFSIFGQIKRLQETQITGEPVNLQSIFTDAALTPLLAGYGITWPRPTSGPLASFLLDWGTDPNTQTTALPALSLSMSQAVQVRGAYPNASENEVAYAQFFLTKDVAYNFSVVTQPAVLPAGSLLEVYFPGVSRTFTFSGTTPATRLTLPGNSTNPVLEFVRIRILSPGQVSPDIQATIQLVPSS